jgi:hypothetical protein
MKLSDFKLKTGLNFPESHHDLKRKMKKMIIKCNALLSLREFESTSPNDELGIANACIIYGNEK